MKRTCRLAGVLALLFAVSTTVSAQAKTMVDPGGKIRIAALYKNDVEKSYLRGIESALDSTEMRGRVKIDSCKYNNELQGFQMLKELMENGQVHIILGPTDSGIFSDALKHREVLEARRICVISPLVTATEKNKPDGWFFRTNVDVAERVEAIHNYLNKCLVRSIAILYANTEFGRQAMETFRRNLLECQKKSCITISFKSPDEVRSGLRQILDSRPEAVGIFGSNEDIRIIYDQLQRMNHAPVSYRPFLFTIMDARQIARQVDDLYFVSVAKCDVTFTGNHTVATEGSDEVEDLTYDTCVLLLSQIKSMPGGSFAPQEFRDQFAALLRGPHEGCGPKTGMSFHNYANSSLPKVFHLQSAKVKQVNVAQLIPLPKKLWIKWKLLNRRYGFWLTLNIVLLVLVVMGVSLSDLKRWYGKGLIRQLYPPSHLHLLIGVNIVLVLILYFLLAGTGKVRYDGVITTLMIAFTPSVLLRTTLFETPTGKAIGLAKLYDGFLLWINDKLMVAKYLSVNTYVNILAYHNSVYDMKHQLLQIYRQSRNRSRGIRLLAELEESLLEAHSLLDRRFVCARRLLRQLDWEDLKGKGYVPDEFSQKEPKDPQVIIRTSVTHCLGKPKMEQKILSLIKKELEKARKNCPGWAEKAEKEYDDELESTGSAQGKLHVRIRFLYVQLGYREDKLKQQGLLP